MLNKTALADPKPARLNLGAGTDILPGFVNQDVAQLPGIDAVHDLGEFPWPFADNSFDEIRMINVLEHLPDTIKTMEEIWRISRPGAKINIRVPYWNCWQAVADPTHIKFFHQKTFDFFDPARKQCRDREYYTPARFTVSRVAYWLPLVPIGDGRGWLELMNPILKAPLALFSTFLSNIIWVLGFELITIKSEKWNEK